MSSQNNKAQKSRQDASLVDQVLLKTAQELVSIARSCTEIQWIISSLLEHAHHPDIPAELHMLQDIDRMQQTLIDLAALIEAAAIPIVGVTAPTSTLATAMKLETLRSRLLGQSATTTGHIIDRSDTEITWL